MTEPTKNMKPDENTMEFSDPYTIHHSDHTGLILASKPLDGNNYGQWSRAISMGLSAKNKIGFIDGTITAPSFKDAKYAAWKRCNDMVTLWIVNSVHSDIANSIMYTESAAAVWNNLKDRFSQSSDSRIYQIRQEMVENRQGQLSVSSYYTKMKALGDELVSSHNLSVACWSCKFHLLSKFVSQTFKSKNHILSIELCCDDISLTFYSSLSFCILHPKSPISPLVSIP